MKFEYLKGSEKDFEGYHECVTHIYATPSGHGVSSGSVPNLAGYVIAERRPITEPVVNQQLTAEWSGEGLPPVGVECEIKYRNAANAEWVSFRCVGVDCGMAFGWSGKLPVAIGKSEYVFRPIRSPEDVARDAAAKGLVNFLDMETDRNNPFPMTELIGFYDYVAAGKIPGVKLE